MILPLPGEESELWNSFAPKLRAQIRRPQRENPQVYFNESTALDEFYSVFSRNMRDLGTPVYSKSFFCSILDYFTKQSHIIVIKLDHRPVAAAFLLGHGDTLEIPWASTIREVNHYSINMLLYWEVLRFAIKKRYVYFDFGRSSKGTGTYRFKQQWGAQPKPLYWHYWLKNGGDLPSLNPSNPKYALMINIWKRLPIPITNLIGPMVVKNLP
jgi:FemAB-related protein (PEP-CTERM system-associated)